MVFTKISIHNRNIEVRKEAVKNNWEISKDDKKDLIRFLEDLGLGQINRGKKISGTRQLKYLDMLKTPLEFLNKSSSKLNIKDIEKFDRDLTSNKILSYKKKPYEVSTKADMRRMLKIYLKWKFGDNDKFKKLAGWLDTSEPKRTPDYLKEEDIIKLYKSCKTAKERYLIAVLFDSGARAEEFFNIRYEDVELPKENNFVKITLKSEYSKTDGRTISLFWGRSLEAVRDYLREREIEGIKNGEPVFKDSYDNMRIFLYRLGKKVLSRSIHAHLFRHSSATYFASKLNRQQLCYRYGWKFSSDMVDVYISRAGMNEKELEDKFTGTKMEEMNAILEREKQTNKIKQEATEKQLEELRKKFDKFASSYTTIVWGKRLFYRHDDKIIENVNGKLVEVKGPQYKILLKD